jgi:hypothetical protein
VENQLLLIPADCYSIDTNVFIEIWSPPANIFSKARMPELWDHIEKLVEAGKIFATKEVYDELKRHATPELLTWLKNHKDMFIFEKAQVEAATHIINDVYSKYKEGYRPDVMNGADPFVVAAAMTRSAVVFTLEHEQPNHDPANTNSPKIPTVCDIYGIEHVNIEEFIRREGFKIGMVSANPPPILQVAVTAEATVETTKTLTPSKFPS